MQQPSKAEYPQHPDTVHHERNGDASGRSRVFEHARGTTYQGIRIGDDARAHFGDRYQQNHGLVINANNVDFDESVLQRLARLDLHSPSPRRTFGLCLGQAPQIEQDAFIGRRAEIQQIQEWFSQDSKAQRAVSIVGMGGLGKTQLAITYAREHRDRYTSLFWVNAKNEVSLRQSFSTLASVILTDAGTPATSIGEEKTRVELVRRWLSEDWNYEWFMIFDNYDDPNLPNIRSATGFDIRSFFPHRMQGHILITTRSPKLTFSKRLMLQKFNDIDSCLAILTQRAGRDLTTGMYVDARRLAVRLDGLPLALATAGTYLAQTSASCTEYLQAYESAWTDLYGPGTEELLEYEDRTLSSTWNVSFDQVCRVDADAAELLKFWAYFSNKDIWYELIRTGADGGPAWMRRITANKIQFDRTMTKLQDYSLVEVMAGSYSIHPCVHAWISERFDANQTTFLAALKCDAASIPHLDSVQYWAVTKRLLSHIDRLNNERFRSVWEAAMSDREAIECSNTFGISLYYWDYMDQAETILLRALAGCERELGLDDPLMAHICNNLGLMYLDLGFPENAEEMYERALAEFTKAPELNGLHALTTSGNLGRLYYVQGKLDQAMKIQLQVLKDTEAAMGPDHSLTLSYLGDLGLTYLELGRLAEAEQMLVQALAGKERLLGYDHVSTLEVVARLGFLYFSGGKLEQAEEMCLRAFVGMEMFLGPDHTMTLNAVQNLGVLYREQGRLDEAEEILCRLLSACRIEASKLKLQRVLRDFTMVRIKALRTRPDNPQDAKHWLARLVRLADHHVATYTLARALFWMGDEENYIIAFSLVSTAQCDGCDRRVDDLTQGHHICRQCDETDLCNDCVAKYGDENFIVPECSGHDYFDAGTAVIKSLGSSRKMKEGEVNAWIDRLKAKYPLATDVQEREGG